MGHHYVPRKYLKGFAQPDNSDAIWMYDKKLRKFTNAGINSVAQEAGFYSDEVEKQLSEFIEKPANLVLNKLRRKINIDDIERIHLSTYIATMMKRVPSRRTMAISMVPDVLEKTIGEIREQIQNWANTTQNKSLAERRLNELSNIERSYSDQIPKFIMDQIRLPWPSQEMIDAINSMSWNIISSKEAYFITSDNPAYFFQAFGIGTPDSELTFPIANDLALFTSWQGDLNSVTYRDAEPQLVREANKRIASGAERFVFSQKRKDWIAKISNDSNPYLNRIIW